MAARRSADFVRAGYCHPIDSRLLVSVKLRCERLDRRLVTPSALLMKREQPVRKPAARVPDVVGRQE
jgi:hypothetical protein